jgi:2-polyprenyl-3-methyl-5-hydroxy-6-metoxy-1,4-benzoquinol methylase
MEANRMVSCRMVERVLPFHKDGAWLDVGFGNASLLLTAQEYGFEPVGLDLRNDNVSKLKSLGIKAYRCDISTLEGQGDFAVISMADVLEHIPFPKQALCSAHRLLKPGGALFISMPNAGSKLWEIATSQNANPYWGELEHYHNFTYQRLERLLIESGFIPKVFGLSERYRMCMEVVALNSTKS